MARFHRLTPSPSPHRPFRPPLTWGLLALVTLGACSESGLVPGPPGTGGATGSGGTASGGAAASGGDTATGGATTGGASSGGAPGGSGGTASGGGSSGGAGSGGAPGSGGGLPLEFTLTVEGVDATDNDDCDDEAAGTCPLYPEDNTSFGTNVSPAMAWVGAPQGTQSYALTLVDLSNDDFAHWALWDIPPETLALSAALPEGATLTSPAANQANNFGGTAYFGSGQCMNVYEFRLYALGTAALAPADAADPDSVIAALEALTPLDETFVRMQSRDYCP